MIGGNERLEDLVVELAFEGRSSDRVCTPDWGKVSSGQVWLKPCDEVGTRGGLAVR